MRLNAKKNKQKKTFITVGPKSKDLGTDSLGKANFANGAGVPVELS